MGSTRRSRPTRQSAASAKGSGAGIEKVTTAEKRALALLAKARQGLTNAIGILVKSKAGSSKEEKARRMARAAMKALIAAKKKLEKKLRKAQRKRSKATERQTSGAGKPAKSAAPRRRPTPAAPSRKRTRRPVQRKRSEVKVPETAEHAAAMELTRVVTPAVTPPEDAAPGAPR